MNEFALLIAASLSAGTPLALAGLGLLINEKVGVVNLGAEGMMLIAAVVGFATAFHTGSELLAFAAGAAAGALSAGLFGVLAIWLYQPIRHRPGSQPVWRRIFSLCGRDVCG